jgi:hypothetical protein
MENKINLKEIEKSAYTSFLEDGLYELVFAYLLLIGMLSSTLREAGVSDLIRVSIYVPIMFLGILIIYFGKKYITVPRLGTVKFGAERKKRIKKLGVFIFTIVVISVSIAVSAMTGHLNKNLPMSVIIPIILVLFFAIIAWYQDYPRFLIIGLLYASTELIYIVAESKGIVLGRGALAYGVPGLIILTLGIHSLLKFLKKYPKVKFEESNE